MAQTRKQKKREQVAQLCEQVAKRAGFKSEIAMQLRATNRRVDKRKKRSR